MQLAIGKISYRLVSAVSIEISVKDFFCLRSKRPGTKLLEVRFDAYGSKLFATEYFFEAPGAIKFLQGDFIETIFDHYAFHLKEIPQRFYH